MTNSESSPQHQPIIIEASRGWVKLNLREVIEFRDLLYVLAIRDIKLRYRQTALGPVWVILQPLLAAGVFTFVFGGIAKLSAPGHMNYYLFAYSGQLGWNLFSGTLTKIGSSLVGNAHLVSKVYFPRIILPLYTLGSVLFDFAAASVIMIAMMIGFHHWGGVATLSLPLWIALLLLLAMGIGLCVTALNVFYRDVSTIVGVFMSFLVYISPVGYAREHVPAKLQIAYTINPVSGLLEGFRWAILGTGAPSVNHVLYSTIFTIATVVAGLYSFKRMEKKFADVM